MILQTALEATMLLCFGLAWPLANIRMMRTRRAEGKGLAFTLIILVGYVAGATAKWLSAGAGQPIPGLFWLYTINAASVSMNLGLQWYFSQRRPPSRTVGDRAKATFKSTWPSSWMASVSACQPGAHGDIRK